MVWETLKEELIFTGIEAENADGVFEQMGGALTEAGYGKPSYVDGLKEREAEYPTGLDIEGFGVAIPHTPVDHANASAISIGILKNPVDFVEMGTDDDIVHVKLVFMLCVDDPNAHIDQLQRIIGIIQDQTVLKAIGASTEPKEIIEIIRRKEAAMDAA